MKPFTLSQACAWTQGQLRGGHEDLLIRNVFTDSRQPVEGGLFVALVGERFDAHHHLQQAVKAGAIAVMVHHEPEGGFPKNIPVLKVNSTLIGLQQLASGYRQWLNPLIVGITGSNGKTSTKDLLSAALSAKYQVRATRGNLNNHIGVPLTLLSLEESDTCGVVEMGMNHPGEIQVLARLSKPDAGIITNIGTAHIEHMKSREAIAREKGMLAREVGRDGLVVLPASDDYADFIQQNCHARILRAGIEIGDVQATNVRLGLLGMEFDVVIDHDGTYETASAKIPVAGAHMVSNATLAIAAAWGLGVPLEKATEHLSQATLNKGRLQLSKLGGVTILDDTYNANPDSMRAGLSVLTTLPADGRRMAVLGKMGELGEHAPREHDLLGQRCAELGIDALLVVGECARAIADGALHAGLKNVHRFETHEDAAQWLHRNTREGDLLFFKGSRSANMERVIASLSALS